ncbi:MAG TPA: alpha/beta hydrolase [Candidatus Wallbacteria bacterium]|nr:alpha/beta hydrolase [Candidatus Wallbacteria bacterium]
MIKIKKTFFLFFILAIAFAFHPQNSESAPKEKTGKNKVAKKKTVAESETEKTDKPVKPEKAVKNKKKEPAEKQAGVKKEFKACQYIFKQAGTEIGSETLKTRLMEDGTFEGCSEIAIRTVTEIKLTQKYSLNAKTYELKKYVLTSSVAGVKQNLKCEISEDGIDFSLTQKNTTETTIFPKSGPLYLLDNMNANNFLTVVNAYSLKKGGRQSFTCFIPQRAMTTEVVIEKEGAVTGKLLAKTAEFLKYKIIETTANLEISAYMALDGSLAAVIIPSQRFEMAIPGFEPEKIKESRTEAENVSVLNGKKIKEVETYFESKGKTSIYGKLLLPVIEDKTRKIPLVLLIAGSGPTDHNGNSPLLNGPVNTLKDIAEYLAMLDIATFRYDKRNIGKSSQTGDSPFSDYVADASSALKHAAGMKEFQCSGVYVLGHSEGGLIALSMEPGLRAQIGGLILMAAPFTPFDKLLLSQTKERLSEIKSISEKDREDFLKELATAIESVKNGRDAKLKAPSALPSYDAVLTSIASQPKFMKEYLDITPLKLAENFKNNALLLYAELDAQVAPAELDGFETAFKKNNVNFSKKIVKGANHVFKPTKDKKDMTAYTNPNVKLTPEAFSAISAFITNIENNKK